jgi:hypothetical protein
MNEVCVELTQRVFLKKKQSIRTPFFLVGVDKLDLLVIIGVFVVEFGAHWPR